ncbi:MAG: transglycosylase SLT domain-containing protein [Parasphingorhabdus sp.]
MPNFSIHNNVDRRDLPSVIKQSAQRTGVDFNYLVAQAQLESGMRPDAEAKTSSATGLYQFIEQTWLGLVKDKGQDYGIGWAQNAISSNNNGHLTVASKSLKSSILALRKDPELAANLAGEFASDNSDYLEKKIGRKPESVDLYLAHFLGPAGAAKFLVRMDENPSASAAPSFQKAARANRNIFYDRAGQPRSFQSIRDRFDSKLSNAVDIVGVGKSLPQSGNELPPISSDHQTVQPADYLRIASMQLEGQKNLSSSKPFNEPARAAYLMLASLGM